MPSDNVLIIFVKYPQEGFVKTRLAKEIGKKNACELYRLFVETILSRLKDKNFTRIIFYTPADKRKQIEEWIGSNLYIYSQKGGDLGEKLSQAFRFAFKMGAKRVVAIGTDSPILDRGIILKAFKKLKNVQCVLGPAFDGGYYLLGLASFYGEIFQGIDWGSNKVFTQTLRIIKKLRISFSLLDKELDIDNKDDLSSLSQRLHEIYKGNPTGLGPLKKFLNKVGIG